MSNAPREFWIEHYIGDIEHYIDDDYEAYIEPQTDKSIHVIEFSAYQQLLDQLQQLKAKIYAKEINNSPLRTYDGTTYYSVVAKLEDENEKLAEKCRQLKIAVDKADDIIKQKDKLQSALEIAVKYLEKIDINWGTDYCSGDTMIAHEALEEIRKVTNG